ncbi:MAG: AsmA family protein [Pararhodobacter sp.]
MRWIFRAVGALVSLAILAVAALFLIPAERIAGLAAQQFEAATGRSLQFTGSVRPSLYPVIGARVEGVVLANAPWARSGPMLQAESVDLGLDLAALLRGELAVTRFEAQSPRILVERGAGGAINWVFDLPASDQPPSPSAGGGMRVLSLESVRFQDATLRYFDAAGGTELTIEGLDLALAVPNLAGRGELRAAGSTNGQSFTLEMTLSAVAAFLAGEVSALEGRLTAGGASARFDGRGGLQPLAFDGQLALEGPGMAPFMALAGQGGTEPLPAAARPLALAGRAVLAPAGTLHLRDATLALGVNRMGLSLDLGFDGPRPHLGGEITAGALNLRPWMASDAAPAGGGAGWSRASVDASALGLLDARIGLVAGPVQTGFADLDSLRGVLSIERARAVLELGEVRAFGGRLQGELVANNRSGLSVGGNLSLAGVELLPLLRQFAGYERLSGRGDARLRFLGVGQSLDAIMRSLSGEGNFTLGEGEILGFDLAGMLRNLDMSYMGEGNRTIYQSLTGSFVMEAGVLRNEDLRLGASRVSVEGRGRVDLGGRTLDYRVVPSALRDPETGQALRVPLLITGPWDAPRFRLDLEGLAEERLREERERLEARAREEVQRLEAEARARADAELQQRLGIERREGQSTEDALREGARDRLEQEVERGLRRFLGGSD